MQPIRQKNRICSRRDARAQDVRDDRLRDLPVEPPASNAAAAQGMRPACTLLCKLFAQKAQRHRDRSPAPCKAHALRCAAMRERRNRQNIASLYVKAGGEALAETLWPTRCAICDTPGDVLCPPCERRLSLIDWWRACPRCGAPFGRVQCCECNEMMLEELGLEELPYDGMASAVAFDDGASTVVRTWKDAGERRLARKMARIMAPQVPPEWFWDNPLVTCVPATLAAKQRRGFDHASELADELAASLDLRRADLLARPRTKDQRSLGRHGRAKNLADAFHVLPAVRLPSHALLVDDVCTTGATAAAATIALKRAGVKTVHCITFARV